MKLNPMTVVSISTALLGIILLMGRYPARSESLENTLLSISWIDFSWCSKERS